MWRETTALLRETQQRLKQQQQQIPTYTETHEYTEDANTYVDFPHRDSYEALSLHLSERTPLQHTKGHALKNSKCKENVFRRKTSEMVRHKKERSSRNSHAVLFGHRIEHIIEKGAVIIEVDGGHGRSIL